MALLFWFYVLLVLWFLGASFSLMYYSTQLDKCWYGDWIYIGLVAQTSHCFIGRFMKVQPVDSQAGTEISADPQLPTQHIISVPPRVYIYCPNVTRNLLNLSFKSQKAKISLFQSPIPVVDLLRISASRQSSPHATHHIDWAAYQDSHHLLSIRPAVNQSSSSTRFLPDRPTVQFLQLIDTDASDLYG